MNPFAKKTFIALSLILVISLIGNGYQYYLFTTTPHAPQEVTQEDIDALVEEVGQVIVLPEDETPTTATVTDPAKLADQPFFAKAQAGDRVLIYQQAQKAILWRPSTKQVIEVSNLNLSTNPQSQDTQSNYIQGAQ